ncbi:MAG: NAD-dependent epimerase/dehydratase family protein [Deltaproteobacteria bacterium]|nr:NAD-dependent epimerase/dehydratase family protein [Candidatus Tharpella sp.]
MNIVISGASSQIGYFLLPVLQQRNCSLWLLGRVLHSSQDHQRWLSVDLDKKESRSRVADCLGREISAYTYIHLAPLWLLPALLADLKVVGALPQRLVALSSTSRLSKINSEVSRERDLANRLAQAEEMVEKFCSREKIPWTIFRPTLIYGCGRDENITFIKNFIRRFAFFPLAGPASGLRQPVHAEDLAGAIEKVLSLPVTYRKIYNLGGGETLTYRQMVARIFTGLGKKERLITLPSGLFRWLLQMICLFNNQLDISPAMVRRMNEHLCYDYEAAERDFNYQPRGFEG